jgi:hypothetical protein
MENQYILYYDLAKEGFNFIDPIVGLIIAILVSTVFYFFRKVSFLFFPLSIVSMIIGVLTFSIDMLVYKDYLYLKKLLLTNQYKIMEGRPERFLYLAQGGHGKESFYLNGIKFEYADNLNPNLGFHRTVAYGGPIKEGVYIKICYYNNHILKLEIRK